MSDKGIKAKVVTKDIKVIDKANNVAKRMKNTSAKTKDVVDKQSQIPENSANVYAVDKASELTERIARKGGQQLKQTIRIGRKRQTQRASEQATSHYSRSGTKKAIKTPLKSTLKKSEKGVKTAAATSHKAIKTTKQTKRAVTASASNTRRSMQATKAMIKATARTTKLAVKATIAAIKAVVAGAKALIALAIAGGSTATLIIFVFIIFGAALTLLNENDSNAVSPLSAEVLAHEPLIRHYAEVHGIYEHVPLIMAVMMQESGGRGLDPMQSSESDYNTRYPRVPDGITDVAYSVNVGIQTLASCFRLAEVQHPFDMDAINLGLQGYNFGSYYITWATYRDGGYTLENVIEFSFMMANRMGWDQFGDIHYVPNVLRFWSGVQIILPDDPLMGDFQSPFPNRNVRVTSEFGYRMLNGRRQFHVGIDLVAHHQAPVSAIASGTIVTASFGSSYGFYVTIRHDNGMYSRYAHLDRLTVGVNQTVVQGQVIGTQGNTGNSFGSHLHLEIRTSNSYGRPGAMNPRAFIDF